MRMKKFLLRTVLAGLMLGIALPVLGSGDDEASAVYLEGRDAYLAGDYYRAAKLFGESELLAESTAIRANSILARIGAWRMCGMLYREYEDIETLLTQYPEYARFGEMIDREFEIGAEYWRGKRDPMYWSLRWIPWLIGDDKSIEVLEKALSRAPFAAAAPAARLRLAYLYQEKGMVHKSLAELRRLIKDHPGAPECRYAYLALADGLFELSRSGDGDGRYVREASDVLAEFRKRYPEAEENEWARRKQLESKDIQAARLYETAEFYRKNGREAVAARYLARVVRDYPESAIAPRSEAELAAMDDTFVPGDFPETEGERIPSYDSYAIPAEAARVLIVPGAGGNHFLLPVPDLKPQSEEVKP